MAKTSKPHKFGGALAVIDIGAHAARLKIAQPGANGSIQTLESINHPLPLGADVVASGNISARNIRLTGEILKDFARVMQEYGVSSSRAVVSSSAGEALNLDLFLHQAYRQSGIRLEVLEAVEEIRLLYLSIRDAMHGELSLDGRNAMICSIGTGSSHILFLERGRLCLAETIRVGTLSIMEELGADPGNREYRQAVDPFVSVVMQHLQQVADTEKPECFIAVGSPMQALVSLGRRRQNPAVAKISRRAFQRLFARVAGKSPELLVAEFGVSDYQALSLEPCCVMVEHFFEISGGDTLLVPRVSTRDAMLQDLIRNADTRANAFHPQMVSVAERLAAKYACDRVHYQAVTAMVLRIFDALGEIHGLGDRERLLLELAGILHEAGLYVSNHQHHKHSYYLLRNSAIPGIMPREQEIIALVSRYHRRGTPKASHPEYMNLPVEERILVTKLAAILRLADALDRSHAGRITNPQLSLDGGRLVIRTKSGKDLHLERWALDRKTKLFSEVFGLKPVLAN